MPNKLEHRDGDWWVYEDPPWLEGRKYKPREKIMCPECGKKVIANHIKNHINSQICKDAVKEEQLIEQGFVKIRWFREWENAIQEAGLEAVKHNRFLWTNVWVHKVVQALRRRHFLSNFLEEAVSNIKDNDVAKNLIRKVGTDIVIVFSYCDPERVVSLIINEKKVGYVTFYRWLDKIDRFFYNDPPLEEIELLEIESIAKRTADMLFLLDKKRPIQRLNITHNVKIKLDNALEQIKEAIEAGDL